MIDFLDRIPEEGKANVKKITYQNGREEEVIITPADGATVTGTPINRDNLMAMQGFVERTIVFDGNSVIETNENGEVLETVFGDDGVITESFTGTGDQAKTIIKTITFVSNGMIKEEIN